MFMWFLFYSLKFLVLCRKSLFLCPLKLLWRTLLEMRTDQSLILFLNIHPYKSTFTL